MLANANKEINMRRKEMIKPDLHDDYKHLCSSSIEPTSFLFGDELPKQVKDFTEVNRVGKTVTHSRSSKANAFGYKSRPSFGYGRNGRYHSSKRPSFLGPRLSAQVGGTYQEKSYRKTAKKQTSPSTVRPEVNNSSNEVCSEHVEIKIADRLQQFFSAWETITSNKYILQAVKGYKIEFIDNVGPRQTHLPRKIGLNAQECDIVDQEIDKLLNKVVVIEFQHENGEFISNIFLRRKKDGNYRMILNLKCFNENVSKHHFKMESLKSAVKLMKPGFYMASADLKDAYYSVPIHQYFSHQKFLKFPWRGKLFQFTCLPNGL